MAMFSRIEKQYVRGVLKSTGSTDKDVLYAAKASVLLVPEMTRKHGTGSIWGGILLTITVIGAFLGIPLLLFGLWMKGRANSNIEIINATYDEYIAELK